MQSKSIPMWWVLLVPVFLLFFVLVVVFILPLEVEIDTERNLYEARGRGIFALRMLPGAEKWRWFYRIFFIEKEWQPKSGNPASARQPKVKKARPPFSFARMRQLLKNMFRAITVKKLSVDWDTDDFVMNAQLYPVFQFLSGGRRRLHINFSGKQELAIHLQTRLYRVAWAFLKAFFHPKFFRP